MKKRIDIKDLKSLREKLDLAIKNKLDIKEFKALKKFGSKELEYLKEKLDVRDLKSLKNKLDLEIEKSYKQELYRKLVHLSSLWIPALIYFTPRYISVSVFSIILFGNIFLEYGNYKKWPLVRKTFGSLIFKILRSNERKRSHFQVSGSVYVMLAATLCTLLFIKPIAIVALTTMLFADTAASLVGKAHGTHKIRNKKTYEGSTAFFVTALVINFLYAPLLPFTIVSVIACCIATLAELYEDRINIDDNLSVPLSIGIILTIL